MSPPRRVPKEILSQLIQLFEHEVAIMLGNDRKEWMRDMGEDFLVHRVLSEEAQPQLAILKGMVELLGRPAGQYHYHGTISSMSETIYDDALESTSKETGRGWVVVSVERYLLYGGWATLPPEAIKNYGTDDPIRDVAPSLLKSYEIKAEE